MEIDLRPMVKKDKPAVMRIMKSLPEFSPLDRSVSEEVCDSYLADISGSGYYVYVAAAGESIAGYVCYGPAPLTEGTWDVYWLAVATDWQRRGIGRRLLGFAEAKIREKQARLIIIETSSMPTYERTRRFYLAMDYEQACFIPDFYAPGDGKVTFLKRVAG